MTNDFSEYVKHSHLHRDYFLPSIIERYNGDITKDWLTRPINLSILFQPPERGWLNYYSATSQITISQKKAF